MPPSRLTILHALLRAATEWEIFDRAIVESSSLESLYEVLSEPPFGLGEIEIQAVLAQQLIARSPYEIERLRAEIARELN